MLAYQRVSTNQYNEMGKHAIFHGLYGFLWNWANTLNGY